MATGSATRISLRYGTGFVDRTTGLRFEGHHPLERPDLWEQYLDGAEASYERYGLTEVFDRPALEGGDSVSLFFVGIDADGVVRAGFRCHGPLDAASASRALAEMSSAPESESMRRMVEALVPYGVIEMKGAWGAIEGKGAYLVTKTLARCTIYALAWLRCELALGAVADYLHDPLTESGARQVGASAANYPTEDYRTVLMNWRRARAVAQSDPEQAELVRRELAELEDGSSVRRAGPGSDHRGRRWVTGWRPVLLSGQDRAGRAIIESLRRDPGIELLDLVDVQRDELRRLLVPGLDQLVGEPSVFVYYPWRDTVVRMVGPRAFGALRTDRNRHKVTSGEQDRLRSRRVGVVGLSVGHVIAHLVAMEGLCGMLRLSDPDALETTNLNRVPATILDVGVNKAVVAARRIAEMDPYLEVELVPGGVDAGNVDAFVADLDVVIEECDSLDVKVLVRNAAARHRVAVLMATSDRGLFDVERFDVEGDRPPFHGLGPSLGAEDLAGLSLLEKVPHVLGILDAELVSARAAASLVEVGTSLTTWPQLGDDVLLGAATAAAALRRLGTGRPLPSGRTRIDLDEVLDGAPDPLQCVSEGAAQPAPPPAGGDRPPAERGVPADPDAAVAYAASRAPSGGNAQPWRFERDDTGLAFHLDPSRTTVMDVAFRGSFVAIGAALFNARVAAAAQRRLGPVSVSREARPGEPVAHVALRPGGDEELAGLYEAMLARAVNRQPGDGRSIDGSILELLGDQVAREGGTLHLVVGREALARCAEILAASERIRFLEPRLHEEMIGELRRPGVDSLDTGIDLDTLELGPGDEALLAVASRSDVMAVLREWRAGAVLGGNARRSVVTSSALAVVAMSGHAPGDYVAGGQAVERLWVVAGRAGLAVQPVSPVFLYARHPEDVHELVVDVERAVELQGLATAFARETGLAGGEAPVLVLRLGLAAPPSVPSRRLPLDQVFSRTRVVGAPGGGTTSRR